MKKQAMEPVVSGRALVDEVNATTFRGSGAAIWWLGQSGFILKSREGTVYIDPYLSEHLTVKYADTEKPHVRMTRTPLRGHEVKNADLLISTHRHSDHMDPDTVPALLEASPDAPYVVPRAHLEHVKTWGIDGSRLRPADVDVPIRYRGIELHPLPAAHDKFDTVEGIGHPYMGFVIKMGGVAIYHSGDTVPYAGMIERMRAHVVDVALLPINGRDARRRALGTPGNCTIEEALCIAALAGVRMVIPHHYDMFTFNTVDIRHFAEWADVAHEGLLTRILTCGERLVVMPSVA